MPTTYAGNSASYPTAITLPSDGDGPGIQAADVNVGHEGLSDRTANLNARLALVEARWTLMDLQRASNGILISPALDMTDSGGTTSDSLLIFTAGVATLAGDIVRVHVSGTGLFDQVAGAGTVTETTVIITANENGGGESGKAQRTLKWPIISGAHWSFPLGMVAAFPVVTPGTLTISVLSQFEFGNSNLNDRFRFYDVISSFEIWRQS